MIHSIFIIIYIIGLAQLALSTTFYIIFSFDKDESERNSLLLSSIYSGLCGSIDFIIFFLLSIFI